MSSPIHPVAEAPADPLRAGPRRAVRLSWWLAAGLLPAVASALLVVGCAGSLATRQGLEAERLQDYDRAVVEYTKALKAKPGDREVRQALERARLRASEDHFSRGRRLASVGKLEAALVELQVAAELNPGNGDLDEALQETRHKLRAKVAVAHEGKTQLQTLIERTRDLPPPGLDLPQNLKLPASLIFRDASSRDVYTAIARLADVSLVFDPAFREQPLTIDLRNAAFEEALSALAATTHTFFRVTAPRTIAVIPDTPAKRREYEEEIVRTFYLSNADLKETIDLLRLVIDARRIAPTTATNALTIKDTPERVAAASRVIQAIDKARPEVIIDVELLEVDRTKLLEYGLQLASGAATPTGINGSASINPQNLTLQSLRSLSSSDILLANLPSLYFRLLKSDTNTRALANPQLRTSEGMAAQAKFGERVPVPVTTFAPIATGGTPQQPITSFNYENIGVNIDITPRTHHDDDVSLALKVEVSSISGTGFGGLPTFGNRSLNTVIRLRDGETNILAGLIRDEERTVLNGVPGLSDLPVIGRLFAHNHKETVETDIVLTLTPHIIRVLDLTESDLRPFRVGRDSLAPMNEVPLIPEATPPPRSDDAAPKKPGGGPGR
jgi:general secretion pathway protein D